MNKEDEIIVGVSRELLLKEAEDFVNGESRNITNLERNLSKEDNVIGSVLKELILKEAEDFINAKPGDIRYRGKKKTNSSK